MTNSPNSAAQADATPAADAPAPKKRKRGEKEIFRLEPWQARLVEENLELVDKIVRGMLRRLPSHIDKADLIQQGRIGLMEAARRYDPTSAASFKTFATYRIRGEIIDGLRAHSQGRPAEAGWNESVESIGESASSSSGDEVSGFVSSVKALSTAFELATSTGENPLEESLEKTTLWNAVGRLPERERHVCELLYKMDMTMQDIANLMGTSKASVSRLHKRALERLRLDNQLNDGEGFLAV
ncbi:MAG: sigma-70 family RNA polymerase sigma factor [Thermoleophilia bacterium]|nr:sigma-70 family RNA polymerase sigma factor [Thermoleophilia bacterium]